jgi:hypothetical protein
MKVAIKDGVTYYAKSSKALDGHNSFYPVVEFYGAKFGSNNFWLNTTYPTRSKALTAAKRYINNIGK